MILSKYYSSGLLQIIKIPQQQGLQNANDEVKEKKPPILEYDTQ